MSYQDFMNKVRYWDNLTAKWLIRHFYFMFFQIVLVIIFLFWFSNLLNVIDLNLQKTLPTSLERILINQSTFIAIIAFLMLLNSFWMLFIFSGIQRFGNLLKDLNYNISRLRMKSRD